METESTIPPFVFVDGRKYVLADIEELPVPEMFEKLTPPPRNISASVRWRLYLRHEIELLTLAVFTGLGGCMIAMWMFAEIGVAVMCHIMMVVALPLLPIACLFASRIYVGRHETFNALRLLQDGLVSTGRFVGICATEKKVDNAVLMLLTYQFTLQDGNTYNASFYMANVKKIMALSTESLKLIFYDPAQPNQNMLFDTLPKGIEFDEIDGIFRTKSSFLITQILWLCFGVAVFPIIFSLIIVFLC
jgi:hypothetical protein